MVAQTDPTQAPSTYRAVIGGLQAAPALIAHGGYQEGVAFELTPLGCRSLLGLPARELWNISLELDELTGPIGVELWERLQLAPSWPERFAICDEVLARLATDESVEPALERSWRLVTASAGTVPVAQIARTLGWTRQHFARRFAGEFGLSPKLAARVVRFDRRAEDAAGAVSVDRAGARACGYYDQAHLTRDFRELAGVSPARLLANDLPSVQDSDDAAR